MRFRESQPSGQVWATTLYDNYLFEGIYTIGIKIWDISNPINPQNVGFLQMEQGFPIYRLQNYFYIFSPGTDVKIYNMSVPTAPLLTTTFTTGGHPTQMEVVGQTAFISDRNAGLVIANIANVTSPSILQTLQMPDRAEGIAVQGNYAYLSCWYAGFRIVDISNPLQPTEVGVCALPGLTRRCVVRGDYAYVANYQSGLKIVNIVNPTAPFVAATWIDGRGGITHDVVLSGDTLFVGNAGSGLYMLNIANPIDPQLIGWYYNSYPVGITKVNNTLYVSDFRSFSVYSVAVPELRLLTPNGGEVYDGGTTDTLRWYGGGFPGTITVSINLDYPNGTWIPILENIQHDGISPWFIDRVNTTHARIRIVSDMYEFLTDESDSDFSIVTNSVITSSTILPSEYAIAVAPNPFNSTANLSLAIPEASNLRLAIFDVQGNEVAQLYRGAIGAGNHRFPWRAAPELASGVYLYRAEISNQNAPKLFAGKLLLVR
ncbi:MAG: T9SS type A sorting domain-containing protein [bacterium]|nr:T9SS type A sorting domain-containing protein [bacterium]